VLKIRQEKYQIELKKIVLLFKIKIILRISIQLEMPILKMPIKNAENVRNVSKKWLTIVTFSFGNFSLQEALSSSSLFMPTSS
jgi:hypothetical protein